MPLLSPHHLEKKFEAMIVLWYLWDSLWIPVEMKTRQEIQDILKHTWMTGEKIYDFLPPTLHELYLREKQNPLARTVSSDDTYTSRSFVQSVWETWNLDWEDIVQKLLQTFHKHPFGYGGSTKQAYTNIKTWVSFQDSWVPWWGNGTVMKLASFSAYLISQKHLSDEEIWEKISTFCSITHTHESVILGSYIHHKVLTFLVEHDSLEEMLLLFESLLFFTLKKEQEKNDISLSSVLEKLIWYLKQWTIQKLSDEEILQVFWWGEQAITKYSGRIDITLWICYALFLRNPHSDCIFDAISIGGDTDSYGAIVGNMLGALTGATSKHMHLISQIPEIQSIQDETWKFIEVIGNFK